MNTKYEITDIAHEKYPFLHRIRALRDIGSEVKAGDLGGFVESEGNLSFDPGDDACSEKQLPATARMYPKGRRCLRRPERRTTPIFGALICVGTPGPPGAA